jgi:uncharacterized protein
MVPDGTPDDVNVALARGRGGEQGFQWEPLSAGSLARARRERRFILIDGAAAWCHWCHVMDETSYRDPEVGRILRERFVAIRVDIDARPDIAERYGAWGWPATVVLSPDAEELGKYRGYLPPEKLREILGELERLPASSAIVSSPVSSSLPGAGRPDGPQSDLPAPLAALGWVGARVLRDMDSFYDQEQGGWGGRQKAPLGANVEVELARAAHGDASAAARALFTLRKQRALFDPVWGGIYQYSAGPTWGRPHFEKLMTVQASQIEAYALAYARTHEPELLVAAREIAGYVLRFLRNGDGAFLVSQDADVGAHEPGAPFVDGNVYYARDDAGRRALGLPRVDDHVYPHENGLAIAALVQLHRATSDPGPLEAARKAADRMLASSVGADGEVSRALAGGSRARLLADAAALGRALALLAEVTGEARYREEAVKIAEAMLRDMSEPSGALLERTADPDAAGVFARRDRPFVHNVAAARLLAALSRLTGAASWNDRALRVLAAISTPRLLDQQGRLVGAYLLALDEAGVLPW